MRAQENHEEFVRVSSQPFFANDDSTLTIYHDDILTTDAVAEGSIDLIVTSPPYNVDIPYATHNDAATYQDYLAFSERWLRRCLAMLKDDGRLCLNIPLDKNKGGQQSVGADITVLAKQVGYQYHSTIIWNESNISRRTAWGSWMHASAPYVIAPVELVLVLYKHSWKKSSGSRISDMERSEFLQWTNGVWMHQADISEEEAHEWSNGFWSFSGESKKKVGHPAPFPLELPRRCIKLFSFVGDLVLDPFMGSGTTLIAAHQTRRHAVGVEIDDGYCVLAQRRIDRALAPAAPRLRARKAPSGTG